ncbi:LysM peptidoglycan-binding domain-containing protein [Microbacterium capsulatum]|uniref:LysM peptidoglycan-binding domain-containing protein n=1 Tax=Microbacterium capsulatum TaxID=3041921 RepID=A0ABU0XCW1_9MICO|nr:LysM peptidoglycan-binding domain-containing protein [Microbacterium sp. ASV81]MDQ4212949.1 LysM peptidoglycan-binding domain-containing protein [Microbacterium sp. ASV81]
MTTTPFHRRALRIAVPTAVLTTVATALAALPAHAETIPAPRPLPQLLRTALAPVPHASAASGTGAAAAVGSYTVQDGDTLWDIARHFGTTVSTLIAVNGLTGGTVIHPGQVLQLAATAAPAAAPAPAAAAGYTVVAGDTLWSIAHAHGTTVAALYAANGLGPGAIIYPGQSIQLGGSAAPAPAPAPAAAPTPSVAPTVPTCTVTAGDTLWSIASAHGTTVAVLYTANGLGPGAIIYPGQTLRLAVPPPPPAPAPAAQPDTYTAPQVTLNADQASNAQRIIQIGRALGVPARGIVIALATAMVESGLTNHPGGDRDSVGLFQQRPSTGWGTKEQISDRDYAITAFYRGTRTTNGLLDIPNWQNRGFGEVAQAVQVSAYPGRYVLWEPQATAWLASLG